MSKNKLALAAIIIFGFIGLLGFSSEESIDTKNNRILDARSEVAQIISNELKSNRMSNSLVTQWKNSEKNINIQYSVSFDLQNEAEKLLTQYKPDYGAIFMMNAETGRVLAMASYERGVANPINWNLQASFPAASVFKVVTATAAVDKAGIEPYQKIHYNGGAYTLYRRNVMTDKITRWTNVITLREAFARSINTAFGRLSLLHLEPSDLQEYAERYQFNKDIPSDFTIEKGSAQVPPNKTFEMTEVASGYNRSNRMSPVQGAMIAAAVANDGKMVAPYLVNLITDNNGEALYIPEVLELNRVMSAESAKKVRELMEQTVISGTSRKSFKNLVRDRRFNEIEIGGKTGHLTGDNPRGRVDWFVGYALDNNEKIAISAITVNKKFWTVKSSHLGQSMVKKYFLPQVMHKAKPIKKRYAYKH